MDVEQEALLQQPIHTSSENTSIYNSPTNSLDLTTEPIISSQSTYHHLRFQKSRTTICIEICILIFLIYTATATTILLSKPDKYHRHSRNKSYSPANAAIQYVMQPEYAADHHRMSVYSGPPSEEQYAAWLHLIEPIFFRVSKTEMLLNHDDPDASVKLLNSDDYLGSFGVYHEIHCLRRLKFYLLRPLYYQNVTDANMLAEEEHLHHCIESLLQTILCKANTALYTYKWEAPNAKKPASKSTSEIECVDWEMLDGWARERMVGLSPELEGWGE